MEKTVRFNSRPELEKLLQQGFKPVMIATRDGAVSVYETDRQGVIYDKQRDVIVKTYYKEKP